jgi:alpha/beta superfamily hydrolase
MTPTSRLKSIVVPGPAGPLEALLQEHEGGSPKHVAVVCHPHPLFGGTMHNKVVHRVASVMHQLGATVLRFNFRGVGASAGTHDQGRGEREDARAALAFVRARHPDARSWLGGFSFGSWIAARLAAEDPALECVTLIAPPIRTSSFESMHTSAVPKLVVQGTADTTCPAELLAAEFPRWAEPKRLVLVEGASHFFDRKLEPLGDAVRSLLEPFAARP